MGQFVVRFFAFDLVFLADSSFSMEKKLFQDKSRKALVNLLSYATYFIIAQSMNLISDLHNC